MNWSDSLTAAPQPRFELDKPFGRLALTHVLSLGGDALVALVLAGSLFFSIDPAGARWRIALYLAFTMAPFALVGPFIGPVMDRVKGGRQLMLTFTAGLRALVAVTMISSAGSDSLLLFPEAFMMLVLSKTYAVAKASIVPATVTSEFELVEANSKLQVLGGIAAFAAGVPGGLVLLIGGPGAVAAFCAVVFIAATVASLRVPRTVVAEDEGNSLGVPQFNGSSVLSALTGMGVLRWVVGFVTFLLAFALRGSDTKPGLGMTVGHMLHEPTGLDLSSVTPPGAPPVWHFGVVITFSAIGGLLGAAVAPHVRRVMKEEMLLVVALFLASSTGLLGALIGDLVGMGLLALGVAVAAAAGKQSFDAVVQRDAPESERGRLFGRFESRFQIIWVLGAAVPVIIAVPVRVGSFGVFIIAAAGAAFYWIAVRAISRGHEPPRIPSRDEIMDRVRGLSQDNDRNAEQNAEQTEGHSGGT